MPKQSSVPFSGPVWPSERERLPRECCPPEAPAIMSGPAPLENSIASTSIFVYQATKSQRWMPWRLKPMKDVGGCEKPRGAAYQALIRGYPNGETHRRLIGGTPV